MSTADTPNENVIKIAYLPGLRRRVNGERRRYYMPIRNAADR